MTPEEVAAWLEAITGSYTDAEITTLEKQAHAMDVAKVRLWVDSFIDEAAKHFDLEIVLEAMTDGCIDLEAVVRGDNDAD